MAIGGNGLKLRIVLEPSADPGQPVKVLVCEADVDQVSVMMHGTSHE